MTKAATWKAGDAVEWSVYGTKRRGTIVEDPNGSVVIIREHGTWRRTWANIESLSPAQEEMPA